MKLSLRESDLQEIVLNVTKMDKEAPIAQKYDLKC